MLINIKMLSIFGVSLVLYFVHSVVLKNFIHLILHVSRQYASFLLKAHLATGERFLYILNCQW